MVRALVITGPTASGKTRLAVALCRHFGGEIISADSRQVYRGLDIGTGKDLEDYSSGGQPVPYHLIDVAEPMEDFHLFRYMKLAREALEDVASRGRLPVICGGSPLYIKALLDGYDQEGGAPDMELRKTLEPLSLPELIDILRREADSHLLERTDLTQKRRVIRSIELARGGKSVQPVPAVGDSLVIAPYFPRKELHSRIEKRLDERLSGGMLEEVKSLNASGLTLEKMDWLGLEYRFAAKVLGGELGLREMREQLLAHIRQFCKRQDGWFRKLEREGKVIHWIPGGEPDAAQCLVRKWLDGDELPAPEIRLDDIRY